MEELPVDMLVRESAQVGLYFQQRFSELRGCVSNARHDALAEDLVAQPDIEAGHEDQDVDLVVVLQRRVEGIDACRKEAGNLAAGIRTVSVRGSASTVIG